MKKIMIICATSFAFAGSVAAILSVFPVKESHAITYTVKKYTVKPAFASTYCASAGGPVVPVVHMDQTSTTGPCDCPSYYNYNGLVQTQFMGFLCPVGPLD